ncbi:uncharacterized protein [Apostichopus japonicus]|uniref:uncharacterized protein isoform X1 n=1 Tax=Stichopus japonicus TaxID=307972 RepID=UPI003AB5A0E7
MKLLTLILVVCLSQIGSSVPDACHVCNCTTKSWVLCGSLKLPDVPRNIPVKTTFIFLRNNSITDLHSDDFWKLVHLNELVIMVNQIKTISALAFGSLIQLQRLLLQSNMISELPHEVFSNLTNLEVLFLNKNNIKSLPQDIFWNLHKLTQLYLFNNDIDSLPRDLFCNLSALTNLYLFNNKISILPEGIFRNLTSLTNLYLYNNFITTLSDDMFIDLHSMRFMYLQNNKISRLSNNIFQSFSSANTVDVRDNGIHTVCKDSFQGLVVRVMLYLSGNSLQDLPPDLFTNVKLQFALDLSDANISEISPTMFRANHTQTLQALFLQMNHIKTIPQGTFDYLVDLVMVVLSNNYIHVIDDGAFSGPNLAYIYLFGNNLTEILDNPFTGSKIKEVHLYGNDIKTLSLKLLMELDSDTSLYLNCASLSELPRDSNHEIMKCVTPQSLPPIPMQGPAFFLKQMMAEYFNASGFSCDVFYECVPCKPGTFADREQDGCHSCPRGGFFQDGIGQVASVRGQMACKQCNMGTYVKDGGGSSTKDCEVCPEGTNQSTFAGYRACSCKENYARTDRYGPCTLCQEDGLNCSKDYKALLPGFMWTWEIPDANLSNYKKYIDNVRQEKRLLDSFTSYNETFPVIFECPRPESCANDNGTIEGTCAKGYQGWLCFNCQPTYYSVLNVCVHCPSLAVLILETCSFVIVCVLIMVFLLWQMKNEDGSHETRTILDVIIARIKILLGFYQVVGEIFTSFHDIKWTGPLIIIGSFISSLEMNILKLFVRPRCYDDRLVINPKIEFILAVTIPVAVILFPVVFFSVKKIYVICRQMIDTKNLERSFEGLKSKLFTYVVVLLFIIYPSVCSSIFQLYPRACKTFFLDDNSRYYIKRLRSDLDVDCDNLGTYNALAYVFTVVYIIGFPASLLYVLWLKWRERNAHDEKGLRQLGSDEVARHDQVHEDNDDDDEDSPLIINDSRPTEAAMTTPWLEFLCENYKDDFWFWEIIELTRKVSQTLLITLYGWEDRLTVLLTTCISVIFLVLHARYRPMKSSYEQSLQMLSLAVIFINVLVAANKIPDTYEDPVSIVLILLNVLVLVIITGEVLCTVILHIKNAGLVKIINTVRGANIFPWRKKKSYERRRTSPNPE